jgi:acetyl-CoA carboxylase carboxyl transferase subunit alpha
MLRLGIVDRVVPEPAGGAHNSHQLTADILRPVLRSCLQDLEKLSPDELLRRRHEKLRKLATCVTGA